MSVAIKNISANTTTEVVAGVASKQIVVSRILITATATQNFTLKSDSDAISANHRVGANSVVMLEGDGVFRCANGEDLDIVTDQSTGTPILAVTCWYAYE